MSAVLFDYSADRIAQRMRDVEAQAENREALLRDEIEKWKGHRAWSDTIVRAYFDLLAERGL